MSYYLRAFCTGDAPRLRTVLSWAAEQDLRFEASSADLDDPDWEQVELAYSPDKQPLIVERNAAELLRDEVQEFFELLDEVADSAEKRTVVGHLAQSKSVVAVQLLNGPNEDSLKAAGTFLACFVDHCGGLVQADAEGFYKDNRLIVPLG